MGSASLHELEPYRNVSLRVFLYVAPSNASPILFPFTVSVERPGKGRVFTQTSTDRRC